MSARILSSILRVSTRSAARLSRQRFAGGCSGGATVTTVRCLSSSEPNSEFPDTLRRVGQAEMWPDEHPGCIYEFNWCLNGDGVTPIRRSAYRITKPLDLKVAGLEPPKKMPLSVKPADKSKIPEAGTEALTFENFDEVSQRSRDLLSLSDHLYCPEGHVPGTRTAARVITNSPTLAPSMLAYMERAPRKDPPDSLPITVYALEGTEESFAGYAIEEVEVPIDGETWHSTMTEESERSWESDREWDAMEPPVTEPKSVASIVVVGQKLDIKVIVAGMELSQKALAADELEREAKKEAEEKASE